MSKPTTEKKEKPKGDGTKKTPTIASFIDPLLMKGGYTIAEIVEKVKDQVKSTFKGKSLTTNVCVRIYTLRKRGYKYDEDKNGKVKLSK